MIKDAYLLIDGYNVLNNWPELSRLKDANLAHARDKMAHALANYAAFQGYLPVLVFDAYAVKGKAAKENHPGITVVFTGEGETADSYIEKTAYGLLKDKKTVFVVTGDYNEQLIVMGMGAYRLTVSELIDDCCKVERLIMETSNPHPLTGRREIAGRLDDDLVARLENLRRSV